MSDTNNDLSSNTERSIPSYVGQYRPKVDERLSAVVSINLDSVLTKAQRMVCDFFKCTVNWDQNNERRELNDNNVNERPKCFGTRQTAINFENHLKEKHSSTSEFFCVYCFDSLSNTSSPKTYPYKYLIKHMLKRHRFRQFQCNLCLYRALTKEHVMAHQKSDHPSEYLNAINYNVSQMPDNTYCKIFLCPKLTESGNENRNLLFYYNKYKSERFNSQGKNETYFQCLYCSFMDELLPKVIEHCVQKHADYPLLYYIPDPQISSSSDELVDDFSTLDNNPVVQTKLEPQDNCVSSTQKSPEAHINTEANDQTNKRRHSTEIPNNDKRIRVESSEGSAPKTNVSPNINEILTIESNVNKQKICLFCEQTFDAESDATKTHLKTHFSNPEADRVVMDWIQLFVNRQEAMCSFTETDISLNSRKAYYYCPLCVKLAKFQNKFPKNYNTFSDVRSHFWQHCWWLSAKCKVCQSSIPNCDPIIVKHFNDDLSFHQSVLQLSKFKFLLTTETEVVFTSKERSDLEKKCIEVKRNEIIETTINKILLQIKEDFEERLRIKNKCRLNIVVNINRLSDESFARLHKEYKDYELRLEKQNSIPINEKESEDNLKKTLKTKKSVKNSSNSIESSVLKNKETIDSNEMTQKGDKTSDYLQDLNAVKSILSAPQTTSTTTLTTSVPNTERPTVSGITDRMRLLSSESGTEVNRDSDTDHSIEEEELNRISCYHCNDKFKTKRDFRNHSKQVHPNLPQRMYAKPRKQ